MFSFRAFILLNEFKFVRLHFLFRIGNHHVGLGMLFQGRFSFGHLNSLRKQTQPLPGYLLTCFFVRQRLYFEKRFVKNRCETYPGDT